MLLSQRRWSVLLLAVLVLGSAWIWINRVPTSAAESSQPAIPVVGHPAPDFTLQTLDGQHIRLADLRGRAVVLNFWASWCPPCRAEMPELEKVYTEKAAGGLVVLGTNQGDAASQVSNFVHRFGIHFPIVLDSRIQVSRLYRVNSLPTTYFIDRDGIIRARVIGGMNAAVLADNLRTIYP